MVIAWMGLLTIGVIFVAALALTLFGLSGINGESTKHGLLENFWLSMTRVLDPGTFAGEIGVPTRLVMLVVTLSGVFIAGSLIGLISNGVDQRVEELQRGRSDVIERDHTLILGWSTRVPTIVSELVIANESRKSAAVVLVADVDKTVMEATLRDAVPNRRTTKIVCRTAEPWTARGLEIGNLPHARSIVIVGDGDDTVTVKTLLAVHAAQTALTDDLPGKGCSIIAEAVSTETATSLKKLFGNSLATVCSETVIAEFTAQACRQRGLSTVFRELLDFDGDEIYFAPFPQLAGCTYADAQMRFERSSLIGVFDDGVVQLNPPPSYVVSATAELIGIAEDDSLFLAAARPVPATQRPVEPPAPSNESRRVIVVGWSSLAPRVIAELDEFLDSRTTIEVVLDPDLVDVAALTSKVVTTNVRLEVTHLTGGAELAAEHAAKRAFHEVIVLGYRGALPDDVADMRTMLTLLAFSLLRRRGEAPKIRIVAEMLDHRNAPLAVATGVDDYVVSDELASLMVAQLSERADLAAVFSDLFDRQGCSIQLRPAPEFGGVLATTFADVVATASSLGVSAIGYRVHATGEVVVNPAKSAPLRLTAADEVLVLANTAALPEAAPQKRE